MAPLARDLSETFRVLEPLQRGSGGEPLTVARHVSDLREMVDSHTGGAPAALVGHSWGAMLALAYAAAHPSVVTALALVGCGTFDPVARERFRATCDERMDDSLRRRLQRLPETVHDPDERLRAQGNIILPIYSYDLVSEDLGVEYCDSQAHEETWQDMVRLQREGVYPSAFSAIDVPVVMLHGAIDPHPGRMIRASLEPYLPQLEYREWERCGHYPWLERAVRSEFLSALREWLGRWGDFQS
jgi:pimeloyl-ACP methyl ester carboxylesterase